LFSILSELTEKMNDHSLIIFSFLKLVQTERSFRIAYALILTHMLLSRHLPFSGRTVPDDGRGKEKSPWSKRAGRLRFSKAVFCTRAGRDAFFRSELCFISVLLPFADTGFLIGACFNPPTLASQPTGYCNLS
jgi:hypothetical protein